MEELKLHVFFFNDEDIVDGQKPEQSHRKNKTKRKYRGHSEI